VQVWDVSRGRSLTTASARVSFYESTCPPRVRHRRPTSAWDFVVPRPCHTSVWVILSIKDLLGMRALCVAGTATSNSLPTDIPIQLHRHLQTLNSIFKTYLFTRSYYASWQSIRTVDFERRPCRHFRHVTAPYTLSY